MMRLAVPIAIRSFFTLWSNNVLAFCCIGQGPVSTRSHTSFSINMDFVKLAHRAQLLYPVSLSLFAELELVQVFFEAMALRFWVYRAFWCVFYALRSC